MNLPAVVIGLIFSPIAAIASFLITYEEYLHHGDKRLALRIAAETAVSTLISFIILALIIGIFVARMFAD